MAKPKGWVKEPVRHGLAAKGVKTVFVKPGSRQQPRKNAEVGQRSTRGTQYKGSAFYSESQWYVGSRTLLGKPILVKEVGWYGPVNRREAYQARITEKPAHGGSLWEYRIVELSTNRLMSIDLKDSKAEAKERAEWKLRFFTRE